MVLYLGKVDAVRWDVLVKLLPTLETLFGI